MRARNGRCGALLTAGSDGGKSAEIVHYSPFMVLGRFGFEFSFALGGIISALEQILHVYDGTNLTRYQVKWDDATNTLAYYRAGPGYTTFATGVDLSMQTTLFHTAKVVVDAVAGKYVRFILDDKEYDLSGISGRVIADSTLPVILVDALLEGNAGDNDTLYVDDAVLTQNEPA